MSPAHGRVAVAVAVVIAASLFAAGCNAFAPEVGPLRDTAGESTPACTGGDDAGEDDAATTEAEGGEAGSAPTSDDDDAGACPPSGENPAS